MGEEKFEEIKEQLVCKYNILPMMSNEIDKIAEALAAVHQKIKPISKTNMVEMKVQAKDGSWKTISYPTATYTDMWEMTNDILSEEGLSFLNLCRNVEKGSVIGLLVHKSGQFFKSELSINPGVYSNKGFTVDDSTDPKKIGSWITYLCKYMYKAMMNLPTDDDDGVATEQKRKEPPKQEKKKDASPPKDGCIDKEKVAALKKAYQVKLDKDQISKVDVEKILEVEAGEDVKYFKDIPKEAYTRVLKAITEFGI